MFNHIQLSYIAMSNKNESLIYSGVYHADSNIDSEESKIWPETRLIGELPGSNLEFPYSACLIDHSGRQFVCFHEQCRDHSSCIKNSVPDAFIDFRAMHVHPDDKALFCGKIFPDILKFMEQIPASELPDFRLSFNHRYIRTDGSISQFLQEGTLSISDDNHLPVLNLRVFTEIGDFKTDDTMILSVFRFLPNQGYQKVWSKVYENNHNQHLSPREMEIIKLCLEGLSSKMIAHKLNLSIHTVKNHKRNCMEKTLTHNITELINLCIRRHWL
jgi:DNA-binding CsgD family transcriptional regulator